MLVSTLDAAIIETFQTVRTDWTVRPIYIHTRRACYAIGGVDACAAGIARNTRSFLKVKSKEAGLTSSPICTDFTIRLAW